MFVLLVLHTGRERQKVGGRLVLGKFWLNKVDYHSSIIVDNDLKAMEFFCKPE